MKKTILLSCIAAVLCFCIGFGVMALLGGNAPSEESEATSPALTVKNQFDGITVTARSFYPDSNSLMEKLEQIGYGLESNQLSGDVLLSELEDAIRQLEQLGFYYDYIGNTAVASESGKLYGASADALGPIGGGAGYTEMITTGDYIATDDNTFYDAVSKAQAGQVIFIPGDAVIDLSDMKLLEYRDLVLPAGITLASDRGLNGSGGGILKFSLELSTLFTASDDVRITGLVLQGVDARLHDEANYDPINGIVVNGSNVQIDNCEISGFSGAAILAAAGDVQIHHCYIHHIRGYGNGHGILVRSGDAKISHNLFSNCRNAVTVSAGAGSVAAENNVEAGNALEAAFRLWAADPEAEQPETGAAALLLKNNTVLGGTLPVWIEQLPKEYTVEQNLFGQQEAAYAAQLLYGSDAIQEAARQTAVFRNNVFDPEAPCLSTWNVPDAKADPS